MPNRTNGIRGSASLRLDDVRRDEVKDSTRIQNQTGIKHNKMGLEKTGVFQLQIRYASTWPGIPTRIILLRALFLYQIVSSGALLGASYKINYFFGARI